MSFICSVFEPGPSRLALYQIDYLYYYNSWSILLVNEGVGIKTWMLWLQTTGVVNPMGLSTPVDCTN